MDDTDPAIPALPRMRDVPPEGARYGEAIVLTDQASPHGRKFELDGVDPSWLIKCGYVFGGPSSDLHNVVGSPVSIELVDVADGVQGLKLRWIWTNPELLRPGRYGIGVEGSVLRMGVEDQILRCKVHTSVITTRVTDPYCTIEIEEKTDES